jgi:ArsR family transcriptional regulator, cadmium/lead-responsive transcriptional repressor
MNVSFDLDPVTIGLPKPASPPSGCDLDCKDKLFHSLADRTRLRILNTLCEGAKTVEQIAAATGLTLTNVAIQLERLVDCGCVRPNRTAHSPLYTLNPPGLLQLEAVADEFLEASFKAPEVSSYD